GYRKKPQGGSIPPAQEPCMVLKCFLLLLEVVPDRRFLRAPLAFAVGLPPLLLVALAPKLKDVSNLGMAPPLRSAFRLPIVPKSDAARESSRRTGMAWPRATQATRRQAGRGPPVEARAARRPGFRVSAAPTLHRRQLHHFVQRCKGGISRGSC